jgi:hypothetical protein
MIQKSENRYVAKNTEQFHSQWLYKKYAKVEEKQDGIVNIDNTKMPDDAYKKNILGNMVLKFQLSEGQHLSMAKLNGKDMRVYFEEDGFGFIYLPQLKQKIYRFEYEIGGKYLDSYICNNGTYNAYSFDISDNISKAKIRIYGTQDIIFKNIKEPKKVSINNKNINIIKNNFNPEKQQYTLTLKAKDIQGETGIILMKFN